MSITLKAEQMGKPNKDKASPIYNFFAVFSMRKIQSRFDFGYKYKLGFTYLAVLISIAIIGLGAVASVKFGSVLQRRFAEDELLFIGAEFKSALISYSNATPSGFSPYPTSLEDLLKDPRYPSFTLRHLRKIYVDPLTGKTEWGQVTSPDGRGIIGLYSLSNKPPIKIGNFEPQFAGFKGKTSYQDWIFTIPN